MEKKYQIFISSTYEDLKEERRKVQDTILSMYQFPIGMEMFSAGNEEQWEIIQETIDSSDYYVLIIGHRYGSVIEKGEYAGISYTQKEFRYALSKKVPVLAFLIDNNVSITPDKMEDDAVKRQKLEDFKKEAKDGRMVEWWTSPEDLASKVSIALTKQINRGKRPGWIRADAIDLAETQKELVEMSKRIRELSEENEELKKNVRVRMPKLEIEINGKTSITVPFCKYNFNDIDSDYMELFMDDVPYDAKGVITQEMLDIYNKQLPDRDVIDKYKDEMRFYKQAQKSPFNIDLTVCNNGNKKAEDIYIEVQLPDDIEIYEKDEVKNIPIPHRPRKGKNPIDEFYRSKYNPLKAESSISSKPFGLSGLLNQMSHSNEHYLKNNNHLCIRLDDLMTAYEWSIKKEYVLVPKRKGTFELACSFMCDDYEKTQSQKIMIIVE